MASDLDLAARLPGEANMLAAVVANPTDDTTKLVYADWLDDHNDPRGQFLRQFVHAIQTDQDLPKFDSFPTGWLEIIGASLVDVIRVYDLAKHRAVILARSKPAVAIHTQPAQEGEFSAGGSKFGGLPDLPRGATWPRCDRAPLEFLAQFDLTELSRTVAGRALPLAGLLSFFMYHNYPQDEYGADKGRGVPGGLRIIHIPSGADLCPLGAPDDLTQDFGRPRLPCRLSLVDALDVPDLSMTSPEVDLRPPLLSDADHQLFGYAHVTVLGSDPIPSPEWEQLIRFNSDRKLNWGWGDGHRLFWYIRSDDLQAARFDNTVAIDG